jgi:hypothetical protein
MLNGGYVKVDRVISSVHRDFSFNSEFDWIDAIEWIGEIMSLIGTSAQYVEKVTDGNTDLGHAPQITIEDYRGRLPHDIVFIQQAWNCETNTPMRWSTDPFHSSYYCEGYTECCNSTQDTYKLNDDYIMTSFETGTVRLAYKAFPTDSEGLPLIPDNQSFIEACKWHIGMKIAFKKFLQEKISFSTYNEFVVNRDWYVAQATAKANMPNYDRMENIKNMFTSLIPQLRAHDQRYLNIGKLEQRFNSSFI